MLQNAVHPLLFAAVSLVTICTFALPAVSQELAGPKGLILNPTQAVIERVFDISGELYRSGDNDLYSFLSDWKVEQKDPMFKDYINVQTPFYKSIVYSYFKRKEYAMLNESQIKRIFRKPQIMTINAVVFLNKVDSGTYVDGYLMRNGVTIEPVSSERQSSADFSQFWPNPPAYRVFNRYDFDITGFTSKETVVFYLDKGVPVPFIIDFSSIR